ncbi:MAG: protein serine/threonine phosphatase 2C family protein [Blautia sp.]|nr:protein serine/threonine phosphatase 2C family protein [Blautia sp.]
MSDEKLKVGSCTSIGDRDTQQDLCSYAWCGNMLLAVLCDGMGGMEGGELASRTGVQVALDLLREQPPAAIHGAAEWMKTAFIRADEAISYLQNDSGVRVNAGTTEIMVMVDGNKMQWGCVGDSRIYLKRGRTLSVITRMHNYDLTLDRMLQTGQINEEERKRLSAEEGEKLISYLGIGGVIGSVPIIDIGTLITLEEGDVIVLCSDGVYKSLSDAQVNSVIEECGGNMDIAAHRIVGEACRLAANNQDNTTAIAIQYGRWNDPLIE